MIKHRLPLLCILSLAVTMLVNILFFYKPGAAHSSFQQGITPEQVTATSDSPNPCDGPRDYISAWNVGQMGGEIYELAVYTRYDCELEDTVIVYGTFSGGPGGWVNFPDPSGDRAYDFDCNFKEGQTVDCLYLFFTVDNPEAFDAFYNTPASGPTTNSGSGTSPGTGTDPGGTKTSNVVPIVVGVAVVAVGAVGVVVVGGVVVAAKIAAGAAKKSPVPAQRVNDPEAAIRAWQLAARQAELEAEQYARQWETVRASGDPNDPGYQAMQKQYQDYIQYQHQQAAEARRKAQEIGALEQQYQQEVRQQRAYRRHRQAENSFIERENQRQVQRQSASDRENDRVAQKIQRELNKHKIMPGNKITPLPTAEALANLAESMKVIDDCLKVDGVYVRNFWQGDPTYIVNWTNQGVNQANDWLMNNVFGKPSESLTCQGYVNKTFVHVKHSVNLQFPDAKVENILFGEKSTMNPDGGWGDWFDSFGTENHNLIKVTLPNGEEYAVDFHQHNAHILDSKKPPILRPWRDAQLEWKINLGANEFTEVAVVEP